MVGTRTLWTFPGRPVGDGLNSILFLIFSVICALVEPANPRVAEALFLFVLPSKGFSARCLIVRCDLESGLDCQRS